MIYYHAARLSILLVIFDNTSVGVCSILLAPRSRMDASPKTVALPTGGFISTVFVYQSVDIQRAANSVYVQKSTADGLYAASNAAAPKKYTFKTDYERMQYIIGMRGSIPGASGY